MEVSIYQYWMMGVSLFTILISVWLFLVAMIQKKHTLAMSEIAQWQGRITEMQERVANIQLDHSNQLTQLKTARELRVPDKDWHQENSQLKAELNKIEGQLDGIKAAINHINQRR